MIFPREFPSPSVILPDGSCDRYRGGDLHLQGLGRRKWDGAAVHDSVNSKIKNLQKSHIRKFIHHKKKNKKSCHVKIA